MLITPDLLLRARSNDRAAVMEILCGRYPCLHRMAFGLTGSETAAAAVVSFVLRRAVVAVRQWEQPSDVVRWFMHHTLITARRAGRHAPNLAHDPLIRAVKTSDAYYPAFIEALRALPMQQREAFLLHHGEKLDERGLGIAMDCSVQAARQHLREATVVLSNYSGAMYPAMTAQVMHAYVGLAPPAEMIEPAIRGNLRRGGIVKRIGRVCARIAQWCVLLLFGWWLCKMIPMLRW